VSAGFLPQRFNSACVLHLTYFDVWKSKARKSNEKSANFEDSAEDSLTFDLRDCNVQGAPIKKQSLRKNPLSKFFSSNLQLSQRRIRATYAANFVTIFAMV